MGEQVGGGIFEAPEELGEQQVVVERVRGPAHLSARVHCQLWGSDVHCLHSYYRGEGWADGGSAWQVLLDDEVLEWYSRSASDFSEDCTAHGVGHVSLVAVCLEDDTFVDLWTMEWLMLLLVIWMINLRVCGYITHTTSNDSQHEEENFVSLMAWSVSFLMALSSVVVVMILQSLEL